jgi:hypothetical protein
MDGSVREEFHRTAQQQRAELNRLRRDFVGQIDQPRRWADAERDAFHDADVCVGRPEVGQQGDDRRSRHRETT